ncbi:hypothetical protein ACP4OV_010301 [Aristida adscensionis]
MAEMAGSAIVGEVVHRILSGILNKNKDRSDGDNNNIERLEMACIKLDATLEMSNKWQITDKSLLRWRKKLKRVAQECDDTLQRCKHRAVEDEATREQVRRPSVPKRVAYATKSLLSSLVGHNKDEESSSKAVVRRFERLADGADDFLRFVQFCGTPRQYVFVDPLIRHLFAGKYVEYQMLQHYGGRYNYFGIRPMRFDERGLEAMIAFVHEDCTVPKNNFRLGFMLRLSESTDIIGTTVKCLQLVTPHFKSTAEVVIKELTRLPVQDFTWLSIYDKCDEMEHWNNIHSTLTQWFRPDPLCCKQYELHNMPAACRRSTNTLRLSTMFPEQVIGVFLQRSILASEYRNLQVSMATRYNTPSPQEDVPPLKLGVLFMPHDHVEDIFATEGESYAVEEINGEKQKILDVNVDPHQIDELMLPKAIDFLRHNAEAMMYQMSWKSRHGSALLCVEKTGFEMVREPKAAMRQCWRNKSKAFMTLEGERGMEKVMDLGTVQRVLSFLLTVSLVRTALRVCQQP